MTIAKTLSRSLRDHPTTTIAVLALSIRISHLIVLHLLSSTLPPFDASQTLIQLRSSEIKTKTAAAADVLVDVPGSGLRWDAIHFTSIALDGYQWEQQLAFQPLWQGILRLAGECFRLINGQAEGEVEVVSVKDVIRGGMGVSVLAWVGASIMLYKFTTHLFPTSSPRFALLTILLYLIPPTPVPSLPYTEPTYALFSFAGLYLLIAKKQRLLAGLCFAVATGLRATGILNVLVLAGVVILGEEKLSTMTLSKLIKRLLTRSWRAIVPCISTVAPFVLFQWYAYESFCSPSARSLGAEKRPWCESRLPFIYGFVQAEYWNIGLFNYLTPAQLPNILLASPIFAVSFLGSRKFIKNTLTSITSVSRPSVGHGVSEVHPALLVLYLHHWLMMALLLFASHTQIALRVCITDPVIWWNIASVAMRPVPKRISNAHAHAHMNTNTKATPPPSSGSSLEPSPPELIQNESENDPAARTVRWEMTRIGKWWIGWTIIWGAISTVLWAGHYPPA
ncbi:hypothetical protein IAT40_005384 [Kwoniella sp. CBS 6097]